MERVNWILNHPLFQSSYTKLEKLEKDRIFCCHQMNHLLDVARIAYIQNLEQHLGFSKALIYATALLHDIGKSQQYEANIPHEIASAEIAKNILSSMPKDLCFTLEEQDSILDAIRRHRRYDETASDFAKLFYQSDKISRNCFSCPANSVCNWPEEQKNQTLTI